MARPGKKQDRLDQAKVQLCELSDVDLNRIKKAAAAGSSLEQAYSAITPLEHRRRYAQFFTPPKIATLMAEWAVLPDTETLLDPAAGLGALIRAAHARKPNLQVTAFEKDPNILRAFSETYSQQNLPEIVRGDFLTYDFSSRFDAVLMNPPYLRHHDLSYEFDIFAEFSRRFGIEISRLSNAYFLFTLKAASLLRPGGRASIIIPTEWMNANFGASMKGFLINQNFLKEIIYFSSCSDIFDDALTTACVLLLESPAS